MTDFILKCFAESGNAYKAALMLELCGADWQPQWVDFFKGETRSDEYRGENVMGEVPILIHNRKEDVLRLTQSGVILHHLSKHFGKFGGENETEEYEILRWILFDNHKLTSYFGTTRFLLKFMKKSMDDAEVAFLHARALGAFKVLDKHLDGREWVAANRITIADISLCGYMFWPDHISVTWDDYPNIKNWLERIKNQPGWKNPEDLMPSKESA